MGHVLGLLRGGRPPSSIIIDFENELPTAEFHKELFTEIKTLISEGKEAIAALKNYKDGAKSSIRKGMQASTEEAKREAFIETLPYVAQMKSFHDLSLRITEKFPGLAKALIEAQSLEEQAPLVKQFAEVIDFALRFDQVKMFTPQLLNDFSFYKRFYAKHSNNENVTVREVEANKISMFMAHQVPMIHCIAKSSLENFRKSGVVEKGFTELLGHMANILCSVLMKKTYKQADTEMFCMRSMTGCIILYDHVARLGVFGRSSMIKMRQCVNVILGKGDTEEAISLKNAIKFSSQHFNDTGNDPKVIKALSK